MSDELLLFPYRPLSLLPLTSSSHDASFKIHEMTLNLTAICMLLLVKRNSQRFYNAENSWVFRTSQKFTQSLTQSLTLPEKGPISGPKLWNLKSVKK